MHATFRVVLLNLNKQKVTSCFDAAVHHPAALRLFSTTSMCSAGGEWRNKQGMDGPGNINDPLRDVPDWSYSDGRSAPPGRAEVGRRDHMKKFAAVIIKYTQEMQNMQEIHNQRQQRVHDQKEHLLRQKLRPKTD